MPLTGAAITDATFVPCSPPTGAGSCAFSAEGVRTARELGVGHVEAGVDDRDGHAGPGRRDALEADLGEPPLLRLERLGRVGDGGDLVGVLALGERDGAAGAEAREGRRGRPAVQAPQPQLPVDLARPGRDERRRSRCRPIPP